MTGPRVEAGPTPLPSPATAPSRRAARGERSRPAGGPWQNRLGDRLFLLPILVVFVVLFLVPLGQSLWYSFTDFSGYSLDTKFIGLSNYGKILQDPQMLAGLGFTLFYAVASTLVITALAIPLAVALNRRFIGRDAVRSIFFFPAVPSIAVLGLVWGYILSPLGSGVLNSVLDALFGLGPFPWLSDATLARASVVLVGVWSQLGWHAVLYLAYLQSIPADYYEVATIDGASRRQQFWHITLPLLTPAVVISQFLLMTGGLKVYDLPFTLTAGGPGYATYTLTQSIITSGIAQGDYGKASALAVLFTLAVAVVVLAQLAVGRRVEKRFD